MPLHASAPALADVPAILSARDSLNDLQASRPSCPAHPACCVLPSYHRAGSPARRRAARGAAGGVSSRSHHHTSPDVAEPARSLHRAWHMARRREQWNARHARYAQTFLLIVASLASRASLARLGTDTLAPVHESVQAGTEDSDLAKLLTRHAHVHECKGTELTRMYVWPRSRVAGAIRQNAPSEQQVSGDGRGGASEGWHRPQSTRVLGGTGGTAAGTETGTTRLQRGHARNRVLKVRSCGPWSFLARGDQGAARLQREFRVLLAHCAR